MWADAVDADMGIEGVAEAAKKEKEENVDTAASKAILSRSWWLAQD